MKYLTKDSGERVEFPSGFVRDIQGDKPRYELIPLPMLKRVAELYARGAAKYGDSNWQLADPFDRTQMDRFKSSAFRHLMQWMDHESDEDHMAAVVFNLFAWEWCSNHSAKLGGSLFASEWCSDHSAKLGGCTHVPVADTKTNWNWVQPPLTTDWDQS